MMQLGSIDQPSSIIMEEGFDDICRWLCDNDVVDQEMEEIPTTDSYIWSPSVSKNSSDACAYIPYETQSTIVHEDDVLETESSLGLENLLMAHGEAIGLGQINLAEVIQKCVCQKASPLGLALERLALNLFKCSESQEDEYFKQEAMRNFKKAFITFYTVFPYGRFAHFTANLAIIEEVPPYVETIHIVDFDLCEGSQWVAVMEAIAQMNKSLVIISIKHEDHDSQFENTKRNLCSFARAFGLNLKVQEMEMGQIVNKTDGKEFVVFNCMTSLPHMGRTRKTTQVMDFLKIASSILAKNKGIVAFGDGEERERMKNSSDFSSFFEKNLTHYKELYESMEWGFPSNFNEARICMETLFVAPFISSKSWFQKWEDRKTEHMVFQMGLGLKPRPMSRESFNEARELVKEGESPYGIRVEGDNQNEMVLSWNGTSLVRVSVWI